MTEADVPVVADIIRRALEQALRPVGERLAALETRPLVPGPAGEKGETGSPGRDGADGKPGLTYCGVFVEGKTYGRGDGVTYAGSMWHCNTETTAKPDDGSKDWTLMVKHGRDLREKRP